MNKAVILTALISLAFTIPFAQNEDNWEGIKNSTEIKTFEIYMFHFPLSPYFESSTERIEELSKAPQLKEIQVKNRNYIEVLVNDGGNILLNDDFLFSGLDAKITGLLANEGNNKNKPEQVSIEVPGVGQRKISKFYISIQSSCKDKSKLQYIVNDIANGVKAYKKGLQQSWYNQGDRTLNASQQQFMTSLFEEALYYSEATMGGKARFRVLLD